MVKICLCACERGSELAECGAEGECDGPGRQLFGAVGGHYASESFGGEFRDKGVGGLTREIAAAAFELDMQGAGSEGEDYIGGAIGTKDAFEYTTDFKEVGLIHRDLEQICRGWFAGVGG
jgi:hypothetical protein